MSEVLKPSEGKRFKPNVTQRLIAASVLLFGGVGCNASIEDHPAQTLQPIGIVSQVCESFTAPDWTMNGAIKFACPGKSEEPKRRLDVTIGKAEDEKTTTVSIFISRSHAEGNEAKPEEKVKIGERRTVKPSRSTETFVFQNPANTKCKIIVKETSEKDNKPPTVSQSCLK